jgi:hypothetical protein
MSGCGNASFGSYALLQGARSYEGIEVSSSMFDIARQTLAGTSGKVRNESIETWRAKSEQVDLVSSRLFTLIIVCSVKYIISCLIVFKFLNFHYGRLVLI